jgi:LysM repeat protein
MFARNTRGVGMKLRSHPTRFARRLSMIVAGVSSLSAVFAGASSLASADQFVTVAPGQNLSSIAAAYHLSLGELIALNHLSSNPNLVEAGTKLDIPSASAGGTLHLVRPGETLIGIAREYGVSTSSIAAVNKLGPGGMVYAGTTISIPDADQTGAPAGPASPAPPPASYPSTTIAAAAQSRSELAQADVPSTSEVRSLVAQTARDLGVDPNLALAVADQESGFQQRVVSNADAVGAMQVLPGTAAQLSPLAGHQLNVLDTSDNVLAGVLELRLLVEAAPLNEAIAGYYQGLSSVRTHGMYADTEQYVRDVLALREQFASGRA